MALVKLKNLISTNIAIALGLFLFALGYFYAISCKEYTWAFMSADSADWLAQARIWFLPQPFGAPIYIMLCKAVNQIGGDLAKNMVFYLSALPSAISVVLVYFSALKVKGSKYIGIVCALVVIGGIAYMAESSVIREHALAAMFLSGAVLAWTYKKYWGVLLFGGLAVAVNIIPLYIMGVWFLADLKHWREWVKWSWLAIIFGVCPYFLTLYLFTHADYYWFEASLSFNSISDYLGTAGTVSGLSIADLPTRLVQFIGVIAVSYALAFVPMVKAFKKQWRFGLVVLAIFWLYLMDNDPTTWTFTLYAVPFTCVMIAVGLTHKKEVIAVGLSALVLIGLNAVFLNAQTLNNKNPMGRDLFNETMALPEGSLVVTAQGGFVTLNMFYVISQGKNIELDFITDTNVAVLSDVGYMGWMKWANSQGLTGGNSVEIARNALELGMPVYRVTTYLPEANANWTLMLANGGTYFYGDDGVHTFPVYEHKGYVLQPFNQYFDKVVEIR